MGFLRLYLALCVVAAHSTPLCPWRVHDGSEAVQLFFMISGFYMALIAEKYPTVKAFLQSRCLRIFVPFWIVNLGILVTSIACGIVTDKWLALTYYSTWSTEQGGWIGMMFGCVVNFSLIGTDWLIFLADEPGESLAFTNNFHNLANPLTNYVINPPAWSVGVELTFYLLVPWLNRRSSLTLATVAAIALVLRIVTYEIVGWGWDPWNFRFMPFELGVFIMGILSFRMMVKYKSLFSELACRFGPLYQHHNLIGSISLLITFWLLCGVVRIASLGVDENYARLIGLLPWLVTLPCLFAMTRENKVDRILGELSYPLYLTHYFIVGLVSAFYTRQVMISEIWRGPIVAILATIVSVLLLLLLINPLEKLRRTLATPSVA